MAKSRKVLRRLAPIALLVSGILLFTFRQALATYPDCAVASFEQCCEENGGQFSQGDNWVHCDDSDGSGSVAANDLNNDGDYDTGEGWCSSGPHGNHHYDPSCSDVSSEIKACLLALVC